MDDMMSDLLKDMNVIDNQAEIPKEKQKEIADSTAEIKKSYKILADAKNNKEGDEAIKILETEIKKTNKYLSDLEKTTKKELEASIKEVNSLPKIEGDKVSTLEKEKIKKVLAKNKKLRDQYNKIISTHVKFHKVQEDIFDNASGLVNKNLKNGWFTADRLKKFKSIADSDKEFISNIEKSTKELLEKSSAAIDAAKKKGSIPKNMLIEYGHEMAKWVKANKMAAAFAGGIAGALAIIGGVVAHNSDNQDETFPLDDFNLDD